jgi:Cupin domain
MKKATLRFGKGFKVIVGNPRVQAAQMVIGPGDSEGGPKNRHRGSDQWLFVVAGTGMAIVGADRHRLRPHSFLLIEHGERHESRKRQLPGISTHIDMGTLAIDQRTDAVPEWRAGSLASPLQPAANFA